ncbi:YHYH domain-containing protein [Sebaldella termitidis]
MKRLFVLTMLLLVAVFSVSAAHGGRTDKNGCHVDRSTGKRHCH